MPKQVSGYQTTDGTFYETMEQANFHEALENIHKYIPENLDKREVVHFLQFQCEDVMNFCNSFIALEKLKRNEDDSTQSETEKQN